MGGLNIDHIWMWRNLVARGFWVPEVARSSRVIQTKFLGLKTSISQFKLMKMKMKEENPNIKYRAHIYRIYPSEYQVKKLLEWEGANRFLWNLANEERKQPWMRSKADRDKVFHKERLYQNTEFKRNFYTQSAGLTELRDQFKWLEDVPRSIQSALLKKLDIAWQRWYKIPNSGIPVFKKKSNKFESIECLAPDKFSVKNKGFHFPKLGRMPIVIDSSLSLIHI